jgi:hypothetical protein
MNRVRLAPSPAHALRRVGLILVASALISLAVLAVVGAPSRARVPEGKLNDNYGPTMPFGLVQFFGQGLIFAAGVYVGRRWFKIRL